MIEPALNDDYSHGQAVRWTKWIGHLAGQPNLHFLEIGSYEGASARWFLKNILTGSGSDIVCVDTWRGGEDMARFEDDTLIDTFRRNIEPWKDRVVMLRDDSRHAMRTNLDITDHFDVAYIDGGHTAANVLVDSVLTWQTLKVGGICIWDDYLWELWNDPIRQPKMGIDAFLQCYQGKYELIAKEWQVCVKRTA